jgi:S1-C subfamily serine protease
MLLLFYGAPYACIEKFDTNHITAISYGGNSGSPVVNFWGNVVGVLFAGNSRAITESFTVPLKNIKEFIDQY